MGSIRTFIAAALAGCTALGMAGAARAASFDCGVPPPVVSVATVTATSSTRAKAPRNLPGARLLLPALGCMRVQFSAQVKARAGGLRIRLTVNGAPAGKPTFVDFHTTGTQFDNRLATFVVTDLPVGDYTVAIQYSSIDGRPVTVSKGVMTSWRQATN